MYMPVLSLLFQKERVNDILFSILYAVYRFTCRKYLINRNWIIDTYNYLTSNDLKCIIEKYDSERYKLTYWIEKKKYSILIKPRKFYMEDLFIFKESCTNTEEDISVVENTDITDTILPYLRGISSIDNCPMVTPIDLGFENVNMENMLDSKNIHINRSEDIYNEQIANELLMISL